MVKSIEKITRHISYMQWIAVAGVLLLVVQTGLMIGWSSPNIPRLTSENSTIPLTLGQASWVASCLHIGRFAGSVIVSVSLDLLGSKKTTLLAFFPVSISWILLICANSVEWLYASRLISGITFGMAFGSFPILLGEIASPAVRGSLVAISMCGAPLGTILASICESYLPMHISSSFYLLHCLVAIAIFFWLPNSPYHLVKLNELDSARKAISLYQGSCEVEKELDSIKSFVEATSTLTVRDKIQECIKPQVMKTMILVIILYNCSALSGLYSVLFYMEVILVKGKSFLINPSELVICVNVVGLLSTVMAKLIIDKQGRKFLLIVSSIGMTIALTGLGTHFHLLDLNFDPQNLQWIPILLILLFRISFSVGLLIVPSTIFSEIFPYNLKSMAALLTSLTASLIGFLATKAYQPIVEILGEAYMFWIHAIFAILITPFVFFLTPETKGKTFQEIQNKLSKK